jgi:hypothetical protein
MPNAESYLRFVVDAIRELAYDRYRVAIRATSPAPLPPRAIYAIFIYYPSTCYLTYEDAVVKLWRNQPMIMRPDALVMALDLSDPNDNFERIVDIICGILPGL